MSENKNYSERMNKIKFYAKQISRRNSYWYQEKEQLKAILNQYELPTVFLELSCADFHWLEVNLVFGNIRSEGDYRENIVNYLYILDCFFMNELKNLLSTSCIKCLMLKEKIRRSKFLSIKVTL